MNLESIRNTVLAILIISNFILVLPLFSITGIKRKELKNKINQILKEKKYTESIPYFEKFLENHDTDIFMNLLYARSLLFRSDLVSPTLSDEIVLKREKLLNIKSNYHKSARIFEKNIGFLMQKKPRDPSMGKWMFLWAYSELYSGNLEKSMTLFKYAIKHDFTLTESFYNVSSIYESLEQVKDSDIYLNKYIKTEKDIREE